MPATVGNLLCDDEQIPRQLVRAALAESDAADQEAVRAAGADLYLPKPFSVLELVSVVEKLLGAGRAPADPAGQGSDRER